jgi:hypothetical protein
MLTYADVRCRMQGVFSLASDASASAPAGTKKGAAAELEAQHVSLSQHVSQHESAQPSALQALPAADVGGMHTSAYVSIRQHTSAYVSIRMPCQRCMRSHLEVGGMLTYADVCWRKTYADVC